MKRRFSWSRTATAVLLIASLALPLAVFAYVGTDKPDYPPGAVVTISGDNSNNAGYLPGETVRVDVHGLNGRGYYAYCDAIAANDANAAWSCQVVLWNGEEAVGAYAYTATGQSSGVRESGTFSDSRSITAASVTAGGVTVPPGSSIAVDGGGTISATVNVTTATAGAGNANWRSTGWLIATSAPGTVTCVNHTDHDGAGSYSETFDITAPAGSGTYDVYFIAYQDQSCTLNPSNTWTLSAAVVVKLGTTTSVASSLNPSVHGVSVTFTATVDPSAATGTVDFKDGATSIESCSAQPLSTGGGTTTATCSTSGLTTGGHNITAVYSGDASYGGSTSAVLRQTVNRNVPPTAAFTWTPEPQDEGSAVQFTDASADSDGTIASWSWDFGDGVGTSTSQSPTYSFVDDGSYRVCLTVTDNGGSTDSVCHRATVSNVAPTATFNAPSSVDEGSPIDLALTDPVDPSSGDTAAGFLYAFNCGVGSGYGDWSSVSTASCPTTDDGTRTVRGKIKDKDGDVTEYIASVTIRNVAPTATFSAPSPVDEGSPIDLALTDPVDPSSADTAAGFLYAFNCGVGSGYDAWSPVSTASCPTTDDGTRTVKGKIKDKDGGVTEYVASVTIHNVAPTATFNAASPVDEGSPIALALTDPVDPSSADTAAGFLYAFKCGASLGYGAWSSVSTASCPTTDDGTRSVKGKIKDKDGDVTEYTASVTIHNVAPTATFNAPSSVDEGSSIDLALTDPVEPSSADTAADFLYAFNCGVGSGYDAWSSVSTASCPTTDDGTRSVKGKIKDKDGGVTEYIASVTIHNVAPTATFNAPSPVDEGSPIELALTDPVDPSSADTAAGFLYAFNCGAGSGYGDWSPVSTASCPTTDDGTRTVKGKIKDKDGDVTEYTASVTIHNVAPTATFSAPSSVDEGSPIELALTDPADPSSADTAAGFLYAFKCGASLAYGAWSSVSTASCPTTDDGTRTVKGKIKDKDGDVTEYAASVTIRNVAPTATFDAPSPVNEGSPIALALTDPADPSSADTAAGFLYAFDCGAGSGYGAWSAVSTASCPTTDDGTRSVKGEIKDKDGGVTEYTASVTIRNVAPTATFNAPSPVDEGSPIALALTDPVDPSSADTAAGFLYAFDCGLGSGYGAWSSVSTASCPTTDDGTRSVKAKIKDKDGDVTEYTASVTIHNVAPTATFNAPSPVNEGSPIALALTDPVDPSSADTAAGFLYAFDCGLGSGYGTWSSVSTASCPTTDDATRSVKGKIKDKDGGVTEYAASVTIRNVAPTAIFNAPSPVNEGCPIYLLLTHPVDPSSADRTAGFLYAFDCGAGSGYGPWSPISIALCPTTDDGTRTVKDKIKDKDGGVTEYAASVTIRNVAPRAIFNAPSPVNEGSPIALALTHPVDPSSADTAAGFLYAFDCGLGSGYGAWSSVSTASCPTTDDGTRSVKGKIKDKDGGVTEYVANVNISNVPPAVTVALARQSVQYSHLIVDVTVSATDVAADRLSASTQWKKDCGSFAAGLPDAGTVSGGLAFTGSGGAGSGSWRLSGFADLAPGVYIIRVTVRDEDGGSTYKDITLTVTQDAASATYTASRWYSTLSPTDKNFKVPLSATVVDLDGVGDIRTATVTFMEGCKALCTAKVGLVDPNNTSVGAASCYWTGALNCLTAPDTHNVKVVIGGYYMGETDPTPVVISPASLANFITGGGYLVLTNSSGTVPGERNSKLNFSFAITYNKCGTNPQGYVRAVIRAADGNEYEIKGAAIDSLWVTPIDLTKRTAGTAAFTAKCSITNLTTGVVLSGQYSLKVSAQDNGEPGTNPPRWAEDQLYLVVFNQAGGIWFSSNWNGSTTVLQPVFGGNLQVH